MKQQLKQLKQTAAAVGIDSRHDGRRPRTRSRTDGGRRRRPRRRRSSRAPRGRLRRSVGYSEGTGDRTQGKELFIAEVRQLPHARRRGHDRARSARISTTRSSQSRSDGLGESTIVQVVRGQIAYPITNTVDRRARDAREPRRGPGRRRRRELRRERRRRRRPDASAPTPRRRRRHPPTTRLQAEARRATRPPARRSSRVGRLRRLPHARGRRLDRHRRPEPRRREARRGPRRRAGHERARAGCRRSRASSSDDPDRGRRGVRLERRRQVALVGTATAPADRCAVTDDVGDRDVEAGARRSTTPCSSQFERPSACVEITISSAAKPRSASSSACSGSPSPISPRDVDAGRREARRASSVEASPAAASRAPSSSEVHVRSCELSAGQTTSTSSADAVGHANDLVVQPGSRRASRSRRRGSAACPRPPLGRRAASRAAGFVPRRATARRRRRSATTKTTTPSQVAIHEASTISAR